MPLAMTQEQKDLATQPQLRLRQSQACYRPGMGNDVSPLETNHLIVAHQRGMTIVPLAGFQNALKLRVVVGVPPACGPMLLMEVFKGLYLRQQAPSMLQIT